LAISLIINAKKGISALQPQRDLGRYLRAENIQPLLPEKLKGDFWKKLITFRVDSKIAYIFVIIYLIF